MLAAAILAQFGEGCCTVLDVGARWGQQDWWRLPHVAHLHGFEPDAEECASLNAAARPDETYHPVALGGYTGEATLHVTLDPGSSSLLPPDPHFADTYPHLGIHRVQRTIPVDITTLAAWGAENNVPDPTVIKLDTQGTEHEILMGATAAQLASVLAIECEVSFGRMYHNQALLGDLQALLERHGIYLWRLSKLCHYSRSHGTKNRTVQLVYAPEHISAKVPFGRLLWADAVFLRPPEGIPPIVDEESLKRAMLAAHVYQSAGESDIAHVMVTRLVHSPPGLLNDFAAKYVRLAA